jgi:hypothetical protein
MATSSLFAMNEPTLYAPAVSAHGIRTSAPPRSSRSRDPSVVAKAPSDASSR